MSILIIEVVEPFSVKENGRVVELVTGQRLQLTPDQAKRVLATVGTKARIIAGPDADPSLMMEPAAIHARPIWWESADGRILGPAQPEFLAKTGSGPSEQFWIVTTYQGQARWIRSDRLRPAPRPLKGVKP